MNTPPKIETCKICKKLYDPKETKRIYGDIPVLYGCCSSRCYTKLQTSDNKFLK